jgi:hypothetical protein
MSEEELRAALRSPAADLRFVAAHAIGDRRLDWSSDLIARLTDGHPAVRQAARRSLLILSFLAVNPDEARAAPGTPLGKFKPPVDFGPAPTATKAAQQAAARKWTEWWDGLRTPKELKATTAPDPAPPRDMTRLVDAYMTAAPGGRARLLAEFQNANGSEYSYALADVIDRLAGDDRQAARDAFALRMARMTEATLDGYLADAHPEVRRAALHGLVLRNNKSSVPRIIDLLRDPQPAVARSAYGALKHFSGLDYGPTLNAAEADIENAVASWREWWRRTSTNRGG